MDELVPEVAVGEESLHRVDIDDTTLLQPEALRVVHPAVDGDDHP